MAKTIFISHSSLDKTLVNELINLLTAGIGVDSSEIFCTSILGMLKTGKNFTLQIKENIAQCKVAILLITENYFQSQFCLIELGATWALNLNIIPILVSPATISAYNQSALQGIQFIDYNDKNMPLLLHNALKDL